jgi:hypothetical protein
MEVTSIATGAVYTGETGSVARRNGHQEAWRANLSSSGRDKVRSLALGPGGQVHTAGTRGNTSYLARLNPDGSIAAAAPVDGFRGRY